jgi:hypothetical protein
VFFAWGESYSLFPSTCTDTSGILAAFAQRDLLLWRWLAFTQRYPW